MPAYSKLENIRALLEAALSRPISRQLAYKYTQRKDFPDPAIIIPVRLWYQGTVTRWIEENIYRLHDDGNSIREAGDTAKELRRSIRAHILASGGISRESAYWSSGLTANENRRMFGYLDRLNGGMPLDSLATEIGGMYPEAGIQDSDDLINYLSEG